MWHDLSLAEPVKNESIIKSLDPRTKVVLAIAVSLMAILFDHPLSLGILLILIMLGHLSIRLPVSRFKFLAIILALSAWGTILGQALFFNHYPRTVLLTIIPAWFPLLGPLTGGIYVFQEGFKYGSIQALRFSSMLALGFLLTWSTEPRDFLAGVVKLRFPYSLAFMTITAIRFLPILMSEALTVVAVQRLKGFSPRRSGWKTSTRTIINTLRPIFASSLRKATTLALSIEARSFSPHRPRVSLHEIKYRWWDWLVTSALAVIVASVLVFKLSYLLYVNELYYSPDLRWVYGVVREIM